MKLRLNVNFNETVLIEYWMCNNEWLKKKGKKKKINLNSGKANAAEKFSKEEKQPWKTIVLVIFVKSLSTEYIG